MKPVDLARKLRRDAAFEPAALDRGKEQLMAAIRQEVEPRRRPTIVPQLPYQDIAAASRSWSARSGSARSRRRGS